MYGNPRSPALAAYDDRGQGPTPRPVSNHGQGSRDAGVVRGLEPERFENRRDRGRTHDDVVADREWRRTLPPIVVCREGGTPWVPVHLPHGEAPQVWVLLEDGSRRDMRQVDH